MRYVASWILLACMTGFLIGCASEPEIVPSSGKRPPTTPEQVQILQKAPEKYEELGVLTVAVTGDVRWDERGNADAGFDKFKALAAERGANALLLQAPSGTPTDVLVTAGYKGKYFQVPLKLNPRTAVAQAIWVISE